MILFQLYAVGESGIGARHQILGGRVFPSRDEANAYREEFKQSCCGSGLFDLSDDEHLKIGMNELTLPGHWTKLEA